MLRKFLIAVSVIGATLLACGLAQAQDPTKLKIAGILSEGKEAPWETSFINSMNRVIAAKPHGLDIEINYTENVSDNAEQVFRTYAETGEYDILFGDATYADAWPRISCPALFLTGEDDPNSTAEMTIAMAKAAPHGVAKVIAGHRHMVNMTAPDAVNEALSQWLAREVVPS